MLRSIVSLSTDACIDFKTTTEVLENLNAAVGERIKKANA